MSLLLERLDPEAFAIASGCEGREYDLFALVEALEARDDDATRGAMGFGTQAIASDILESGRTVVSKRSNSQKYYQRQSPPVSLARDGNLPLASSSVLAYRARVFSDQQFVVFGHDGLSVTCLNAGRNLAWKKPKAKDGATYFATLAEAVRDTPFATLDAGTWDSVELQWVTHEGDITKLVTTRDDEGWFVVSRVTETLPQRLERVRDQRLRAIFARLQSVPHAESLGALRIGSPRICDPTDPRSNLGWEGFQSNAREGFMISKRDGIAVECVYMLPTGKRRAITDAGELTWID